jgi:hypothetical protein
MADKPKNGSDLVGREIAFDPSAESASATEPGFIAPPKGAPVYHGFQILNDVVVLGFKLGKITEFENGPCTEGDAFVIAPDNSRCGLVWEVSDKSIFEEVCPLEPKRWGVWGVSFPYAMTNRENARKNLESVLPQLQQRWEDWRRKCAGK